MKILFYQYGSICEPDIIDAMTKLNIEVTCITDEIYNKALPPKQVVQLLQDALNACHYDAIFSINFYPVISEVCNIYHIRHICITVDSPILELFTSSISNQWNRLFIFDHEQFLELSQYNPSYTYYLPLATNTDRWNKVITSATKSHREKYTHNISFVGSLYTEKSPYDEAKNLPPYINGYLNGIMSAQMHVYGRYFIEDILPDDVVSKYKKCHPWNV